MGMNVGVDTSELKELGEQLKNAPKPIRREYSIEMKRSAKMIFNHYKTNARAHKDQGDLDKSITVDKIGVDSYSIGSSAKQSVFLEAGTQPHKIPLEPKKDGDKPRFLIFYWPKIGATVYAEQVDHKGTRAQNLLFKAYVSVMEPFERTFAERFEKRLENLLELQ